MEITTPTNPETKGRKMTEQKATHTPGPWTVWGESLVNGGNPSFLIANCSNGRRKNDEDEANARLIAAAPELLDIVKRLTASIVDDSAMSDAANIIAKIEAV